MKRGNLEITTSDVSLEEGRGLETNLRDSNGDIRAHPLPTYLAPQL